MDYASCIIDDLAMCRKDIKECLIRYLEDHYAGELPVIEEFGSGTAFLDKFLPDAYDIIFIDQYMEEIRELRPQSRSGKGQPYGTDLCHYQP